MFAKRLFDIRAVEPLQNIADGRMRRRPLPFDLEGSIQPSQTRPEVRLDAAIRIAPLTTAKMENSTACGNR